MEVSQLQGKVGIDGAQQTVRDLKAVGEGMRDLGAAARSSATDANASKSAWDTFKSDFTSGFQFSAGLSAFNLLKDGVSSFATTAMTAATEYESAMNLLEASSGASAAQMAALGDKARALGADIDLPATSAGGAANAMLELSRAGLSIDESMAAARGTIQLAATEMMGEGRAAQITAGALNAFNLEGREATRVADLLAAGSNASAASVGGLGIGLQQLSASFATNNQSIDTAVTALAALSNVGYSASDSGTALNNMMMRLAAPTQEAAGVMERLGFSAFDAQGRMKPLEQIIGELNAATAGMTDQQRNAALQTIFMTDGMKAMLPLLNLGADGFDDLRSKVQEQGAAAKLAEAQTKGFKGAMEGFKSALESLAVEGLTPLLPLLSSVVRGAAELAGSLGAGITTIREWFGVIQDNAVPLLTGFGTAAVATAISIGGITPAAIAANVSIVGLGQGLAISAASAATAAVSFAAVAIPIAAIGIAVGATFLAIDKFSDRLEQQNADILASRDAYTETKTALESYQQAHEQYQGNQALEEEAKKLEELSRLYEEKMARATGTGGFFDAVKASFDTSDVTTKQVEELKALETQMSSSKAKIDELRGAHDQAAATQAKITERLERNTDEYGRLSGAVRESAASFVVSDEAAKEAEKTFQRLETAGPAAMNALIDSNQTFLSGREQAQATHEARMTELRAAGNLDALTQEETSYRQQEQTAATSYVNQQAAQRTHLGQMLIDWVNAQAMINEDFAAKSGELVGFIEQRYGMVASEGDKAWGANLNAIRGFVDGSIPTLGELGSKLDENTQKAGENKTAYDALAQEYITELVLKRESGEIDLPTYQRLLGEVPAKVQTEILAQADNAEAQAQKAQAQYDRVERRLDTVIDADASTAVGAATNAKTTIDAIPDGHTTALHVDAASVRPDAEQAGRDAGAGFATGIGQMAATAAMQARSMAYGAIAAAKQALDSHSPSRVFVQIGSDTGEGFIIGIREQEPAVVAAMESVIDATVAATEIPREALQSMGNDLTSAYQSFAASYESLNSDHAAALEEIWHDYYAALAAENDQFNGDKFDQQLDFYDRIANLDSAARSRAYEEQAAAWDASQQLAAEKGGKIADEYYQTALKQIEADEQRAARIGQIEDDIAKKRQQAAKATSDEEKARLAKEIEELEARKAYLEEVDRQQDKRDAEKLEAIKNQNQEIAEERDKALADENEDYKTAQDKLATDFAAAVDRILGEEDRMLASHVRFANDLIASYQSAAQAARDAAASVPSSVGGEGEPPSDGTHALGLARVPKDGYRAILHRDEAVLTADEALEWRFLRQHRYGLMQNTTANTYAPVSTSNTQSLQFNAPLIGQVIVRDDGRSADELVDYIAQEVQRRIG